MKMERNFAKEACMKSVLLYSANIQHTIKQCIQYESSDEQTEWKTPKKAKHILIDSKYIMIDYL